MRAETEPFEVPFGLSCWILVRHTKQLYSRNSCTHDSQDKSMSLLPASLHNQSQDIMAAAFRLSRKGAQSEEVERMRAVRGLSGNA